MEDIASIILAFIAAGLSLLMLSYADYLAAQNQAGGSNASLFSERAFQMPWKGPQAWAQWIFSGVVVLIFLVLFGLLSIWLLILFTLIGFLLFGLMLWQDKQQVDARESANVAPAKKAGLYPIQARIATLYGLHGEYKHKILECPSYATIGRSHKNHIVLNEKNVSGHHARIVFANGSWFVQDSSRYGTFVNGMLTRAGILKDGDKIRIGATEFEFRIKS